MKSAVGNFVLKKSLHAFQNQTVVLTNQIMLFRRRTLIFTKVIFLMALPSPSPPPHSQALFLKQPETDFEPKKSPIFWAKRAG